MCIALSQPHRLLFPKVNPFRCSRQPQSTDNKNASSILSAWNIPNFRSSDLGTNTKNQSLTDSCNGSIRETRTNGLEVVFQPKC